MSAPLRATGVTRRELLGAAARWSVPTVVTLTLGARLLEAKASCPPCQKKQAGVCKACSVSAMLNCQCEPCLGPPYCSAVGPVAPQTPGLQAPAPGSQSLTTPGPGQPPSGRAPGPTPFGDVMRDRSRMPGDPFGAAPGGVPLGGQRARPGASGLYERLRPDTTVRRP